MKSAATAGCLALDKTAPGKIMGLWDPFRGISGYFHLIAGCCIRGKKLFQHLLCRFRPKRQ